MDPSFEMEAKKQFHLLKLTMLSGRSAMMAAGSHGEVRDALARCRDRLGLADDGATMELWHGSDRVPDGAKVPDWPGVQPKGEVSEYQLLVAR
eukprot:1839807-Amphidinium_carterae.2